MLVFNGTSIDSVGLTDLKVKHSILPPVNPRLLESPDTHGSLDLGFVYGSRQIDVEFGIKADSYEDMRDKVRLIASALHTKKLKQLVFSDEPDKYYMARVVGMTDVDELYRWGTGTISFLCPNPFATSFTETNVNVTGSQNVTVSGSAEVYPLITIDFTTSKNNYTVTVDNDESYSFTITDSFVNGDTVTVDCSTGSVKLNGTEQPTLLTIDSDLPIFENGMNIVAVEAGANVSITYHNKWL